MSWLKNNWFKIALLVILLGIIGGWFYWFQWSPRKIAAEKQFASSISECSKKADDFFHKKKEEQMLAYELETPLWHQTNHYNTSLKRCFMVLDWTDDWSAEVYGQRHLFYIYDPYEGAEVGGCKNFNSDKETCSLLNDTQLNYDQYSNKTKELMKE